jgi:hypothetical protein
MALVCGLSRQLRWSLCRNGIVMSKEEKYLKLRQALAKLTPRKSPNKQAVEDHIDFIEEKLNEGVAIEDIAEAFREVGFNLATSTLRQYIRGIRQPKATTHDNSEQISASPKSGRKRTSRRKADEAIAENADNILQPSAEVLSTGADPIDPDMARDPELVSDGE